MDTPGSFHAPPPAAAAGNPDPAAAPGLPVPKQAFILPAGAVWLNWGQTAPAFADAAPFAEYCRIRTLGAEKARAFETIGADIRTLVAGLFCCAPEDVFVGANTTSVMRTILECLLQRWPGMRLIATRQAYASLPLMARLFTEVTWVAPTTQAYVDAVRACTGPAAVLVESQEYRSGGRYNLHAIAQARPREDVHLVADLSQWPDHRVMGDRIALCFSGAKWAGGPNGIAIGVLPPAWPREPAADGWAGLRDWTLPLGDVQALPSAARLDAGGGGKPFLSMLLLRQGLQFIARLGRPAIEAHVMELSSRLRHELKQSGFHVLPVALPSGNTTIGFDSDAEGRAFFDELERQGVICTYGLRRIRLSPGPWTDLDDLAQAVDRLHRTRARADSAAALPPRQHCASPGLPARPLPGAPAPGSASSRAHHRAHHRAS